MPNQNRNQDPNLIYQSIKTYTHSAGYSCCFRQWRADSHCKVLHGYALQIELIFEGPLDDKGWVKDFGSLGHVKAFLTGTFDHKTVVALDDPMLGEFIDLHHKGLIDLVQLPAVGMEKFAEYIFRQVQFMFEGDDRIPDMQRNPHGGGHLVAVRVWEHEGNSAKVIRRD